MKAIAVTDRAAGTAGMALVERPEPQAALGDVVVQVHASGFEPGGQRLAHPHDRRPDRAGVALDLDRSPRP